MSGEEHKETLRRFLEAGDAGNVDAFDDLIAEDVIDHQNFPGIPPGREGVKQVYGLLHQAFSNLKTEVDDLLAEGDRVVVRSRLTGIHTGEFLGVPASNKPVDVQAIDIIRFQDGKMAEHWGFWDTPALIQQIGAMPGPGG